MAALIYTATKRIISGHVLNTAYSKDIQLDIQDFRGTVFMTPHESLDGTREVVLQPREDDEYTINIIRIAKADLDEFKEFFYSVVGNVTFTMDFDGTVATPDDPQTFVMISTQFNPVRNGTSDWFSLSLNIRIDV